MRVPSDAEEDPELQEARQSMNRERARRRAAKRMRLYAVHNRTANLNTLTYRCWSCNCVPCSCGLASQPSRAEAVHEWQKFAKRLRRRVGSVPYLGVIEYGGRTGRIHHHFAVRESISQGDLEDLWPHGFVTPGDREPGATTEGEARRAAAYCSTYAGKALDAGLGRQAYYVAQGFQPVPVAGWARSESEALDALARTLGGFDRISRSEEWDGYDGPQSLTVRLG